MMVWSLFSHYDSLRRGQPIARRRELKVGAVFENPAPYNVSDLSIARPGICSAEFSLTCGTTDSRKMKLQPCVEEPLPLSTDKLNLLESIWASILASPNAVDCFAQIIDGRITRRSFIHNHGQQLWNDSFSEEFEPSSMARHLYDDLSLVSSINDMKIDIKVSERSLDSRSMSPNILIFVIPSSCL